jgi:hypothetical protein
MWSGYPLYVAVTLQRHPGESLGNATAVDRAKTADTYTSADVERLLAAVRTAPCSRCSTPAFDPSTVITNRGGLCEACFLSDLKAEFAGAAEAERQEVAARDHLMRRRGMVVRVSAWVHPQGGGDDYQVDWYLAARPTPERVKDLLRNEGSRRLDDYEIITL